MIVPKRQNMVDGLENVIVSSYVKGMSVSEIEEQIREVYNFDISTSTISRITQSVANDIIAWQNRPLKPIYLIVWMDDIVFKVRESSKVINKTIYLAVVQIPVILTVFSTLITKNLSQSLKHINYILNEFDFNDRPNTFIKAEILNIIIHFELKNYKLVLHNLNSFKKKYTKTFKINALEKKILKLIEAISNDPYLKKTSIEFANLHKKIVQMEIEKTNSNLIYLNYILSKK